MLLRRLTAPTKGCDLFFRRGRCSGEMMETTRKAAFAKGETYYDTGKPCKLGHYSKRYTSSYVCVECDAGRWNRLSEAEKDPRRKKNTARSKRWRLANPERNREYQAAYRAKQREKKLRDIARKERRRQYQKAYRAKQRARKLAATE